MNTRPLIIVNLANLEHEDDFSPPLWKDPELFSEHIRRKFVPNMYETDVFYEFKAKIESESNLIVVPESHAFCMSIFDAKTKLLQAYYVSPNGPWKVISSNIYLQLVLPNYLRGTIPNA